MWIIAIGWMFVVVLMSVAEAVNPQGTVLGALFTFVLYGLGPVSLVMYILTTPMRRQARRAAEASADAAAMAAQQDQSDPGVQPDTSGLAASDTLTPEGEKPGAL